MAEKSAFISYEDTLWPSMMMTTKLIDEARNVDLKPVDVIVCIYPKSGTTWMKYIAYLIKENGVEETITEGGFLSKIPYLGGKVPGTDDKQMVKLWLEMKTPRLFATHLPLRYLQKHFLETKVKFITVLRNPKDTLVSYFHFHQMNQAFGPFTGSWDDFFKLYQERKLVGGDVIDFAIECWQARAHENLLVVSYEEMKKDLDGVVRKVAKFMGHELSEEVIANIVYKASFDQMKINSQINGQDLADIGLLDFTKSKFIRKGVVGDWKNYFSEEQSKYIDEICQERCAPIGVIRKRQGTFKQTTLAPAPQKKAMPAGAANASRLFS